MGHSWEKVLDDQFFTKVSSRQKHEADLFFAELSGQPAFSLIEYWERDLDPSMAMARRGTFRHPPLGNRGHNVEARWNFDAATGRRLPRIDVVVHLHGYGRKTPDFLTRKARLAGLDMVDSNGIVTVRRSRPTLALVPMGIHRPSTKRADKWVFTNLATKAAFDALINKGLVWLSTVVLGLPAGSNVVRERLILMAHSGGGLGMNQLLSDGLDPDELICYDSTYWSANPISRWATSRIAGSRANSGGLRVFHRSGKTKTVAQQIKHAVNRALQAQGANCVNLARRYRVEQTRVKHNDIPKAFSRLLLDDITATVPSTAASRSPCAGSTNQSLAEAWTLSRAARPGRVHSNTDQDMELEAAVSQETYDPRYRALELKPSNAHGGTQMSSSLSASMLHQIMPTLANQSTEVKRRYLDLTNDIFSLFAIDTIESRALFLAHANVESDQYKYMVEADRRAPYRSREVNAQDPKWRPHYVTPQQETSYRKLNYHNRPKIMGRGRYLYIGRGPLQVTTSQGYRRAVEVLNVWGQALGRRGEIQASARLLHASGELGRNPTLASIPEFGFLLSGAFFKVALPFQSGLKSLDMRVNKRVPVTAEDFLRVSSSMYGVGSFQRLRNYRPDQRQIVIDNLNRKVPVFRNAIQVLCGTGTSGVCANPALKQPYVPLTSV